MSNAKNAVSMTTALTGGAGVGQVITLVAAENPWNPTFQQAYGGAATDIPVSVQAGNDWQTCRCDFNGTDQLTVVSIQSQFKGGIYDDATPTGITLSGTPVAQVSFNASSVVDSLGGTFQRFAAHDEWVDNPSSSPTIDFSDGNNQIASSANVGVITLDSPAGVVINGQLRVDNPSTITSISVPGDVFWAGDAPPAWSTDTADILSIIFDGTDAYIGVTKDFGTGAQTTGWLSPTTSSFLDSWVNKDNGYVSDDTYATHADNGGISGTITYAGFNPQIPAGATIVGIEISCERKANGNAVDATMHFYDGVATAVAGDNLASVDVWPVSDTVKAYGGPTDIFNTGVTDTIANNASTGVQLSGTFNGDPTIYLDHVQLRYWYLEP